MTNKPSIEVIGSGCPSCKKLYEITKQATIALGLDIEAAYSNDIQKIIEMGVMQSPVLAVNGKPAIVGSTQDIEQVKKAIMDNI